MGIGEAPLEMERNTWRRLPIGAELRPDSGVHFRVWAPGRHRVQLVLTRTGGGPATTTDLEAENDGYWSTGLREAAAGDLYQFRLDGDPQLAADPASRFQPEGPEGPSRIVEPTFAWTDSDWRGVTLEGQVLYEMHIGTFTREGSWAAAAAQLESLAELGVTLLEIMPVADFAGRFGWGYDGVSLFAPTRLYGEPDDFRRFVDRAHEVGLGVILDVVYNHFGPAGCCVTRFAEDYFSQRHMTEWGQAINFDGPRCGPVRQFFLANAEYWVREFHLDGLRLDATQSFFDDSPDHILTAIVRRVREAADGRSTLVIGENEPQQVRLLRAPEQGGHGLDALWNDDFHHSARVAVTGFNEGYFSVHRGRPQEFVSVAKFGYLYQGQFYTWQKKPRGSPTFGLVAARFVNYIQNHDQVANSPHGQRLHAMTTPGRYRALSALLLLGPQTPLLFQGQEFASSTPFHYFADHSPELNEAIHKGRRKFVSQFPRLATEQMQEQIPNPADAEMFEQLTLDAAERETHGEVYTLYRDLIRLRREDPTFREQGLHGIDGAVLADEALVLRYFGKDGDDRLLLINFGPAFQFDPAPEPLVAPPEGHTWRTLWSSEDPRYGGFGVVPLASTETWNIPSHAAIALARGEPVGAQVPLPSAAHQASIAEGHAPTSPLGGQSIDP